MAELQTVAAVLDLLKFTYEAGRFLKKVRDADRIAGELETRIKRLHDVLKGVQTVLENREEQEIATEGDDAQVAARINDTVGSCTNTLIELQEKLGGFTTDQQKVATKLWDRVQVALRQPSISRISTELEARIQILSTDLSVLQFFDQTRTSAAINSNHDEVLGALSTLGGQVSRANNLLNELMRVHREFSALDERCISTLSDFSSISAPSGPDEALRDVSQEAIERLTECLRAAEDVHKTFSSEYFPDARSLFDKDFSIDSPLPIETPISRRPSVPAIPPEIVPDLPTAPVNVKIDNLGDGDEDNVVMPLSILNKFIVGYVHRAHRELESDHFNQAEMNLNHAIRYSLTRQSRYGVPFDNRADLEEELATVYSKQRKWGEAVMKVSALLRERTGSSVENDSDEQYSMTRARQNHLLASIYFERHVSNSGGNALSIITEDIENAERHALIAFKSRWDAREKSALTVEEEDRHNNCIRLLVRILEMRDKTVEANEFSNLLLESSLAIDRSNRPPSTVYPRSEEETVMEADKHDILIEAIKNRETEQIQALLSSGDLNLERLCKQKKTFLMHAVESSDESVVHKLLDPEVGAEVNTANKRGLTALHFAVMGRHHEMIRCLLQHDADPGIQDLYGDAPITKAVQVGDEKAVRILFDHDETALEMKGKDEWSLLHFAVSSSQPQMANLLLNLHPELAHAVDQAGQTALHHCVDKDRYEQASVLLRHKNQPDVNAIDSINRTALSLVASKVARPGREDLVRLLLRHGADVTVGRPSTRARDYDALTPQRRDSTLSHTSVSTSGTIGTTSTSTSRLSRLVGRRWGC